jgi:DNA-directed RNA polymerase subunit H
MTVDITKHQLVPKHSVLADSKKEKLFKEFNISSRQLPKIIVDDPAIIKLDAKAGDVILIERDSKTSGVTKYYRVVINE